MTSKHEIAAYNAGIAAVAALARATADRLATRITEKPTRLNFAIGALDGIADEAGALLLPLPSGGSPVAIPAGVIQHMRNLLLALVLAAVPFHARAQTVPSEGQQRLACMGDAIRLCTSSIPNREAIINCLAAQRPQLSAGCRPVFEASFKALRIRGRQHE